MGTVADMEQVGGHPVLDFVNTLGGLPEDADDEHLHGYADLVAFAEKAGLVPPSVAARLLRAARRRRAEAAEVLVAAVALRGSVDRILRAHLDGRGPAAADLDALRRFHVAAVREAELASAAGHFDWSWPGDELDRPAHVVAVRSVDLLREGELGRLRRCGHCRWLFLDTSRNHSRRWCSMSACGSVVKMRRYRAGRRSATRS